MQTPCPPYRLEPLFPLVLTSEAVTEQQFAGVSTKVVVEENA